MKQQQEYRKRRVYLEKYDPYSMPAYYQRITESADLNCLNTEAYHRIAPRDIYHPPGKWIKEFAEEINNSGQPCRYVYDMLINAFGIEFESLDGVTWFMLKYA